MIWNDEIECDLRELRAAQRRVENDMDEQVQAIRVAIATMMATAATRLERVAIATLIAEINNSMSRSANDAEDGIEVYAPANAKRPCGRMVESLLALIGPGNR